MIRRSFFDRPRTVFTKSAAESTRTTRHWRWFNPSEKRLKVTKFFQPCPKLSPSTRYRRKSEYYYFRPGPGKQIERLKETRRVLSDRSAKKTSTSGGRRTTGRPLFLRRNFRVRSSFVKMFFFRPPDEKRSRPDNATYGCSNDITRTVVLVRNGNHYAPSSCTYRGRRHYECRSLAICIYTRPGLKVTHTREQDHLQIRAPGECPVQPLYARKV